LKIDEETRKVLREGKLAPLFESEEDDVFRVSSLNCLAEIVKSVSGGLLNGIMFKIIDVVVDVMRLEKGRLVRRGAGGLAGAIYERVERDREAAVGLVDGGREELLAGVLREGGAADDAEQARCQEAIGARERLEAEGVWAWARGAAELRKKEERGSVGVVGRMLKGDEGVSESLIRVVDVTRIG